MYANQTVISEYPPGSEPLKWHFPERNRIISGLRRNPRHRSQSKERIADHGGLRA